MSTRPAAVIFALCALACSGGEKLVLVEQELREPTLAAVAAWNDALPCLELRVGDSGDGDIVIRTGWAMGRAAMNDGQHIWVDLNEFNPDGKIEEVIAHEIGHTLGAKHSADSEDLMDPVVDYGRGPVPTEADARQICP